MSTADLKLTIYQLLASTQDSKLLNSVYKLLKSQKKKRDTDWWLTISDKEKAAIEVGIAQAERGELIPHEEVVKKSRRLIEKYRK